MTPLEKKAMEFKKAIHGKRNTKHNCLFVCVVSASGELCQIQARRAGVIIAKQTISWTSLQDVKDVSKLGADAVIAMGNLLAFASGG